MKIKYRLIGRIGNSYVWESVLPLPGDSRHDRVKCDVNWFWNVRGAA